MNTTLTSLRLSGVYKSVLALSDQHFPYQHRDLLPFLRALRDKYRFDLIVNMGDEVDFASISFHEKEPELPAVQQELEATIEALQPLYKLFPKMVILDSNHGSLVLRKSKFAGLPASFLKSPREILQAPKGWQWVRDVTFSTPIGKVHACHGKSASSGKLSRNMAMSAIQGHYHTKFQIDYWGSPSGLYWDMHVGCVVDDKSLAMAYNKATMQRPVIGVGVVQNGKAILEPLVLDNKGRWIGKL
jgi:predicted MPP superfamily phosphohydrolase